jgi:hypothetical protein
VQRNLGHSTPVLTSETYRHIAEIIVSARLTDVSHRGVEKRRAQTELMILIATFFPIARWAVVDRNSPQQA